MLKVPAYAYFEDLRVTVYQDDSIFWKFYVIPDYISVRRDINDNPVFLLIKYSFGDQDREENPDLGRGGGYMAFDVEMRVREQDQEALRERLQTMVNAEWRRMKELADAHNANIEGMRLNSWMYAGGRSLSSSLSVHDVKLGLRPDGPESPPGDRAPTVILAVPTWTEGTFSVTAPQSEALVSHRVTDGPLSLVGSNVAAVNMDLTEAGATFMQKTLVETTGAGATDLTPIQVRFDLKFWARIPPVRLFVEADTRTLYQGLEAIMHDYEDNSCDEDQIFHFEQQMSMAVEANLIKVRFDTGTLALDDKFVREIRQTAMDIVQGMMQDKFFNTDEAPDDDDDDGVDLGDERDIYKFKTVQEMEFSSITYDEEMTSIVEWEIHPQGTMQAFFAGLSAAEMRKYVRIVDLDDPFFQTLGLTVSCFANWEANPIAFVEAQVRYDGRDENGQLVEKQETFTFTKDATRGEWDPSLIGAKREYQYRYRLAFHGQQAGAFTPWERERTDKLNLSIPDAGVVRVKILAGQIDFKNLIDQVQVEIRYQDPASNIALETETFVLSDGQLEQLYERRIFTEWDQPYQWRAQFLLLDGQKIITEWEESVARDLLINAPFFDPLDVRLVPTGDWGDVVQSVVSLRYSDEANQYHVDEAFAIKKIDEFKSWKVILRDPSLRRFEYKVITTFANGDLREGEWTAADGDQALPIIVRAVPRLRVRLLPNVVDFGVAPVAEVTLRYDDAANNIQDVETFTFVQGDGVKEWVVPVADGGPRRYRYQVTYHTATGETVREDAVETDATEIVLPRLTVPELKVTLMPRFVSFIDTPVVQADVNYEDVANAIRFSDSFLFTDDTLQTFRVPLRDDSPPAYTIQLTYFNADGVPFEQPAEVTSKKNYILPKFIPELAPA